MFVGALLGGIFFTLYLLGHYCILRYSAEQDKPRHNVVFFAAVLLMLAVVTSLAVGVFPAPLLSKGGVGLGVTWGILTYLSLFVLYMPFFYTISASLSVRTIIALSRSASGRLSIDEIRSRFASPDLVDQRLRTMVVNGFLQFHRPEYFLTPKGRRMAKTFLSLKTLWKLGSGG